MFRMHHPCLASIVVIKFFKFFTPSPPQAFELHNLFHANQLIPLQFDPLPQKKSFISFSVASLIPFEIKNKDIQKLGIDCAADFNKVIFPDFDNSLFIYSSNFCFIRSTKKPNTSPLFIPTYIGIPSNFPGLLDSITPKLSQINYILRACIRT